MNRCSKKPSTRWGVIVFPGSNCDHDALDAIGRIAGQEVHPVWHKDMELGEVDAVILPGGFSYGDYLRSGAIARFAPIMESVIRFAQRGGIVIGICNGFQVLTEAGLLPGALMRNRDLRFVCEEIYLKVERTDTIFTQRYNLGQVVRIPVAHNEGAYFLPPAELDALERRRQVVFRYCSADGEVTPEANFNGSLHNIAGIVNEGGNILGMMPHPERRCDALLGPPDGLPLFNSVIDHLIEKKPLG